MKPYTKNNILLFMLLVIAIAKTIAQQDAMYSQYMVNHFVINPAYAGSRDALSTFLINRNQWMAIPGAPKTAMLSINAPIGKTNGVGIQAISDQLGPKQTTAFLATYSYKLNFKKSNLAFGLRAGTFTHRINWNKVEFKESNDLFANQGVIQHTGFNADFGIFYYTRKFFAGLAINHLSNSLKTTQFLPNANYNQTFIHPHSFLSLGYTFELNNKLAFQPSLILRQVDASPVNGDLNFLFIYQQRLFAGLSLRPDNARVWMLQAYITEKFRIGYSYDNGVNQIVKAGRGAHEIFVGYDFSWFRNKSFHPRYF